MESKLEQTFALLATTSNEAAERLLVLAIDAPTAEIRTLGVGSLLSRKSPRSAERILKIWNELNDDQLRVVQDHADVMQQQIETVLREATDAPQWLMALDAMRMLNLDALLPLLIDRLEACEDRKLRSRMLAVVLDLGTALGDAARRGRERPSVREPIVQRLAEAVRRFHTHRCEGLCEAFLATSSWGDRDLRILLAEDVETMPRLGKCLLTSGLPGVIQLLAGYIRRREVPVVVQAAIEQRTDQNFRDTLLSLVSEDANRITLRNLHNFQPLACMQATATIVGRTPNVHHAALLHAHTANQRDSIRQLTVILDIISRGNRRADSAVIINLERAAPLNGAEMMRAAIAVAESNMEVVSQSPMAQLVWRMVQLLDHPDPAVVQGLRMVMRPLHIDHLLEEVHNLKDTNRRRLGGLVRRIDPSAVQTLGDELRNPVLARRERAIRVAIACDAVEPLIDLIIHSAMHDHRDARLLAIAALAEVTDNASLEVLEKLSHGPASALRDAAEDALRVRNDLVPHLLDAGSNRTTARPLASTAVVVSPVN